MKTPAIAISRPALPAWSHLTARLGDFATLMKPRVMALAVFTALVGMAIAPGHINPLVGSVAIFAIAAGAGAAEVIEEAVQLIEPEVLYNRVLLRLNLASELPLVRGDRVQLQQVIINLLVFRHGVG
jgi:signal transduction histidine kinase